MYAVHGKSAVIDPEACRNILVFGDVHGDLASLKRGLSKAGTDDLIVFLGDYADRGPDGVEVIETIHDLLLHESDRVIALKGNHEDYTDQGEPLFHPCDLIEEARRKRGSWEAFFRRFNGFAHTLLLSARIPGYALFVHGGVGSHLDSLEQLENPDAARETEFLWNDPVPAPGEHISIRGAGRAFGPDVSAAVCEALSIRHIIRSHEPRKASRGPFPEHEGRVITTNSTSAYGGAPSILRLQASRIPQLDPVSRDSVVFLN